MLNNVLGDGEESLPLLRAAIPRDDLDRCYVRASVMTSFTCQNFSKKKKKKRKKRETEAKKKEKGELEEQSKGAIVDILEEARIKPLFPLGKREINRKIR